MIFAAEVIGSGKAATEPEKPVAMTNRQEGAAGFLPKDSLLRKIARFVVNLPGFSIFIKIQLFLMSRYESPCAYTLFMRLQNG